jgi:Holliday junction resolvase
MVRRGYKAELKGKKDLQEIYGKSSVIKVAIGGAEDFLIASCGELLKVIEVKEVHHKKYYPKKIEKEQFERIKEFAELHHIPAELWIYRFYGRGKPIIKEEKILYEVK